MSEVPKFDPDQSWAPIEARMAIEEDPRRRRLLAWLGLAFQCTSVDTPEDLTGPLAADPPALAAYIAAEKAVMAGQRGALLGIPLAFKDIYETAGVRTTARFQCIVPSGPSNHVFA